MINLKVTNVNYSRLQKELIAANIKVLELSNDAEEGSYLAANAWIKFAEGTNMQSCASVLNNHNNTPILVIGEEEILKSKIELVTINTLIELGVI